MNRLALTCAAALLALSAAAPAFAQDAQTQPVTPALPSAPPAEPSHTAAAVAFIKASNLAAGFGDMIPQFIDQARLRYVAQRPEIAQMINEAAIGVVPEFVKRQDTLAEALAPLYTARFTEDELKQMTAFYETPVGKKFAAQQSDVLQASVPVVQAWSRKLSDDIAARIKEEVKKKGQQL